MTTIRKRTFNSDADLHDIKLIDCTFNDVTFEMYQLKNTYVSNPIGVFTVVEKRDRIDNRLCQMIIGEPASFTTLLLDSLTIGEVQEHMRRTKAHKYEEKTSDFWNTKFLNESLNLPAGLLLRHGTDDPTIVTNTLRYVLQSDLPVMFSDFVITGIDLDWLTFNNVVLNNVSFEGCQFNKVVFNTETSTLHNVTFMHCRGDIIFE